MVTGLLDLSRPVCLLLVAVLHFMPDSPQLRAALRRYQDAVAPGSYLVLSHATAEAQPKETAKVTEVYTRTSADERWSKAVLDIRPEKLSLHGVVTVDPVETDVELPDWVTEYLDANEIELGSGTIVIWEKPDQLSARSAGKLRESVTSGRPHRHCNVRYERRRRERQAIRAARFAAFRDGVSGSRVPPRNVVNARVETRDRHAH